jgi:hypothetical protein
MSANFLVFRACSGSIGMKPHEELAQRQCQRVFGVVKLSSSLLDDCLARLAEGVCL